MGGKGGWSIQEALIRWFASNARDLPWRRERTPYRTLVSELMLQQTTVKTVVPRFEEFVKRFPGFAELAAAGEQAVVEAWAGLGYYTRARNLHRAATIIVEQHDGKIPRDLDSVTDLPGIGDYTAGAVLSLSHGVAIPCVDGNVRRVLSRLAGKTLDGPALRERAAELVPKDRPGPWNEGLMELGATVCRPQEPLCQFCPVAAFCEARKAGTQGSVPALIARPEAVEVVASYALIEKKGSWLMGRRRPGQLGGLWEFPGDRVSRGELGKWLKQNIGVTAKIGDPLANTRHTITHHRITATLFAATTRSTPDAVGYETLEWVDPAGLSKLGLTAAAQRLATLVR